MRQLSLPGFKGAPSARQRGPQPAQGSGTEDAKCRKRERETRRVNDRWLLADTRVSGTGPTSARRASQSERDDQFPSGGHQAYTLSMLSAVMELNQYPSLVVASTQSSSRHILVIGGIALGGLLVLAMVVGTIVGVGKEAGILAALGAIFGLACLFGLVFLIASAIGASVTIALAISGGVTFLGLLMVVGVLALAS